MKRAFLISLLLYASMLMAAAQDFILTPQWTPQSQFAGYYAAYEKGFYKEAGIDVEIVHPSKSSPTLQRLQEGACNVITLELIQAIIANDRNAGLVSLLLNHQAAIATQDKLGNTALHYAALANNPESIRILLESGADKECPNTNGKSPLLLAAREGRAKAVAALIQAGSQVNTADHSAHTPLMHAAYRGHLEIVELLLKGGAEVNANDRYHRTALMLATEKAHAEIVDTLLAAGARPMPRR